MLDVMSLITNKKNEVQFISLNHYKTLKRNISSPHTNHLTVLKIMSLENHLCNHHVLVLIDIIYY
jgi:hypothetical protein